jgi:hypothetical protein
LHQRLDQGVAQIESLFGGSTISQLHTEQDPGLPLCGLVTRGPLPTQSRQG